jgi:hypothetical protein
VAEAVVSRKPLTLSLAAGLADKAIWVTANGDIVQSERAVQAGLQTTCQVLTTSRNRAVLPVLLAGMRSSSPEVRADVLLAAIRRHDVLTHTQLVRHFAELEEADQAIFCEAHRAMPHRAASVLKKAVIDGKPSHCPNACAIILAAGDYDLFPTLIKAAENKRHPFREDVLAAISGLADRLHQDLAQWAAGVRDGMHDPSFKRHQVLNALEQSLSRYAEHQRTEILDAFLLLAPTDNTTFLTILRNTSHACHARLVAELSASQDSGIMTRLIDLLRDIEAPAAVLEVIAQRGDREFLNILLHEIKHPAPLRVLHNMKRMRRVVWLESQREKLLELDGRAQTVAIDLATSSNISRESLFELLVTVMRGGMAEGRRATCQALAQFNDAKSDDLVLAALDDPDAGVQAAAVRQLRQRRLPDALQRLVALLDSPSSEVRDAARSSLAEFNFIRYRAMFDLLDEEAARTTGKLVHKVDNTAIQKLSEELTSPSLTTRLRGIEMAVAMAAADDVQLQLIQLARHEIGTVRKEAVLALGHCERGDARKALEAAARDSVGSVVEAARQSLARLQADEARSPIANLKPAGRHS